ncbi:MAG: VOC family protein [Armatimonadota bacterium]
MTAQTKQNVDHPTRPGIVPELCCSDFGRSLHFYGEIIGFAVRYRRDEERFAYLVLNHAELMIEQTVPSSRTLVGGELQYPFGRGMNLQIEVNDADALYRRVTAADCHIFLPIEDRWYRIDDYEAGNRQFVVMDPDGYLLRFWHDLGQRPISSTE